MGRGPGYQQDEIEAVLRYLWRKKKLLRFSDIRAHVLAINEGKHIPEEFERSLRRSLAAMVKRGDVLVVFGDGSQKNPRQYMTAMDFASLNTKKKPRDKAHAREIAADCPKSFVARFYALAREAADRQAMARARTRHSSART
jgi:hypothetical protein